MFKWGMKPKTGLYYRTQVWMTDLNRLKKSVWIFTGSPSKYEDTVTMAVREGYSSVRRKRRGHQISLSQLDRSKECWDMLTREARKGQSVRSLLVRGPEMYCFVFHSFITHHPTCADLQCSVRSRPGNIPQCTALWSGNTTIHASRAGKLNHTACKVHWMKAETCCLKIPSTLGLLSYPPVDGIIREFNLLTDNYLYGVLRASKIQIKTNFLMFPERQFVTVV
jgi:hypothetical protein